MKGPREFQIIDQCFPPNCFLKSFATKNKILESDAPFPSFGKQLSGWEELREQMRRQLEEELRAQWDPAPVDGWGSPKVVRFMIAGLD